MVYSTVIAVCGTNGRGFESRTSTNTCGYICRYVDQKGLAAMLTSMQSAGVAPEVNLRNHCAQARKNISEGIHPGFETQARRHQKSETGLSVAPQKGLVSYKKKVCVKTYLTICVFHI